MTRDLRTLLNLELCVECSRLVDMAGIFQNSWRGAAAEADAIREQQLKQTQLGSSSRSGCNREAFETDAIEKRTQAVSSS